MGLQTKAVGKRSYFVSFFFNGANAPVLSGKDKGLVSKCREFDFCCAAKIRLVLAKIYVVFRERKYNF